MVPVNMSMMFEQRIVKEHGFPEEADIDVKKFEIIHIHGHIIRLVAGSFNKLTRFSARCESCVDSHTIEFDTDSTEALPYLTIYVLDAFPHSCAR